MLGEAAGHRALLAACITRARCWRSCGYCRSLLLEKTTHAMEAYVKQAHWDEKQSRFPSAVSLQRLR